MVVVVVITAATALSLHFFNGLRDANPDALDMVLFRIQQQAGTMAAWCVSIFGVITALRTGKLAGVPSPSAAATAASTVPPPGGVWGRPAREAALS